jgi:hypothetical protein
VAAGDFRQDRLVADPTIWSAGHGVSTVRDVPDVDTLVRRIHAEYHQARAARFPQFGGQDPHEGRTR